MCCFVLLLGNLNNVYNDLIDKLLGLSFVTTSKRRMINPRLIVMIISYIYKMKLFHQPLRKS